MHYAGAWLGWMLLIVWLRLRIDVCCSVCFSADWGVNLPVSCSSVVTRLLSSFIHRLTHNTLSDFNQSISVSITVIISSTLWLFHIDTHLCVTLFHLPIVYHVKLLMSGLCLTSASTCLLCSIHHHIVMLVVIWHISWWLVNWWLFKTSCIKYWTCWDARQFWFISAPLSVIATPVCLCQFCVIFVWDNSSSVLLECINVP